MKLSIKRAALCLSMAVAACGAPSDEDMNEDIGEAAASVRIRRGGELRNSGRVDDGRYRRGRRFIIANLTANIFAKLWGDARSNVAFDNEFRLDIQNPTGTHQNIQLQVGSETIAGVLIPNHLGDLDFVYERDPSKRMDQLSDPRKPAYHEARELVRRVATALIDSLLSTHRNNPHFWALEGPYSNGPRRRLISTHPTVPSEEIFVGPIAGQQDANEICPVAARAAGGSWSGRWWTEGDAGFCKVTLLHFKHDGQASSGERCIQITEPADPHTWNDNYLCSALDLGIRWSHDGAIPGMRCTQVADPSIQYTWNNNYLCVPYGGIDFSWSHAGPIHGKTCIPWREPAAHHTWNDNYLCYSDTPGPTDLHAIQFHHGVEPGHACILIDEPSDPHNWHDNYLCSEADFGIQWSSRGAIPGMRCTRIDEPSDPHTWHDNYLCVPPSSGLNFSWSHAGPIPGKTCTAWLEPSDPHTWNNNYLCY